MTRALAASKRGKLTLPRGMRRSIPKATMEKWIARDEAEMRAFRAAAKPKRK